MGCATALWAFSGFSNSMTSDEMCTAIASAQFGLINLVQALAAGLSRSAIKRRLASGRWERVLPRVFRIAGSPGSWHQDAMAACLWCGSHVGVSHVAAARLWRIDGFESAPIEVSCAVGRRSDGLGFRTHRVDRFLVPELTTLGSIPVTSVRRTLLDLAGVKHWRTEHALDQCLRTGSTTLGQMWLLYEEDWTRGRRGIAILRELLATRTPGVAPTESDLELLLLEIVSDFALPEPMRQQWVQLPDRRIRVDFLYPDAALVIETDGYAYHGDHQSFDEDRERDAELQSLGLCVLRFTWAQLKWRRGWVADIIRRHLATPSAEWRIRSA